MQFSLTILNHMMLFVLALDAFSSKHCIHCKYYKNSFLGDPAFGKCTLFPKKDVSIDYLVTGNKKYIDYYYCSIARKCSDMCGMDGNGYINRAELVDAKPDTIP